MYPSVPLQHSSWPPPPYAALEPRASSPKGACRDHDPPPHLLLTPEPHSTLPFPLKPSIEVQTQEGYGALARFSLSHSVEEVRVQARTQAAVEARVDILTSAGAARNLKMPLSGLGTIAECPRRGDCQVMGSEVREFCPGLKE